MDKRWGISIDVEGFSALYELGEDEKTKAIRALRELMGAIIDIGVNVYPGDPAKNDSDRIFAHQFGDGFIIVSDFEEVDATRCIAIASSLMRHMAIKGHATKAAISNGDMTDISGCYPDQVRYSNNGVITLGAGLMTTIPVMGTALTKAYNLSSNVKGNVLAVDCKAFGKIPKGLMASCDKNACFIDWRSDKNRLSKVISEKAGLEYGDSELLTRLFDEYIERDPKPPELWIEESRKSVSENG